ncbi:signal peptidase I [Microbacterium indicum]|uniref:signal peptidase I n=1 Tax=Microbacterium indicum TaxID=358100 RepID=UPI000403399D|nr:signal peptidase I [Microbacterium indicum]
MTALDYARTASTQVIRKSRRIGRRVAGAIVGGAAALGLGSAIVLSALHVSPLVIISGSMEPGYPIGTIVYSQEVDASTVEVGDVVTTDRFNGPGTVTHRVIRIEQSEDGQTILTLKGDNNDTPDRETYTVSEVGVTRLAIPYIGLPQLWVENVLDIDPLTA